MATHRRKVVEVEARKYMGPATLSVVHDFKGQQSAKKGDWLVGNEKGKIEVVSDLDFQRDYEPIGDESGVGREWNLGTSSPEIIHPAVKPIDDVNGLPLHEATVPGVSLHGLQDAPEIDAAVASSGDYAGISRGNVDEVKAVGESAKVEDVDGNTHELNNADGQLDTTTHQE